jgi:hypothetical protein
MELFVAWRGPIGHGIQPAPMATPFARFAAAPDVHNIASGCTNMSMARHAAATHTQRMDPILVYCRPRNDADVDGLRVWLELEAARLSAETDVRRTAIRRVAAHPELGRASGWLLECEFTEGGSGPAERLRPLLTDMRLVGLQPTIFVAEPTAA